MRLLSTLSVSKPATASFLFVLQVIASSPPHFNYKSSCSNSLPLASGDANATAVSNLRFRSSTFDPLTTAESTAKMSITPTVDEMIFAISQVNFCAIYRQTAQPPLTTGLLFTAVEDANGAAVADGHVNSSGSVDGDGATVDCDDGNSEDPGDSDDEDEAAEEAIAMLEGSQSGIGGHEKPSKQLILLDLLAILLVTEPKFDVAATMLVMGQAPIFFYSKNSPLTEDENLYVQKLFTYACHPMMTVEGRVAALQSTVIDKCRKKITARVKKVLQRFKSLKNVANRGINSDDHLPTETREKLMGWLRIECGATLQSFITKWLEWLPSAQSPADLEFAICTAYLIGGSGKIRNMMDFQLLRRIRKVGDYAAATRQLVSAIDLLSQEQRDNLQIQEVSG